MADLTEEEVVFAFAKAWNRLEPDGFLALLSPDARYASQWVFEELVGVLCWRRFKSDQACRLNFDQGPAPGFLMPGCG